MAALYPLTFQPRFKERVWGGRTLEALYGKALPAGATIGESWEVSDRPGDESVLANGPLAGQTLRQLMEQHGRELLGSSQPADGGRFPLLCKILDARDTLSVQVHPPSRQRGYGATGPRDNSQFPTPNSQDVPLGDPKTEMWYIAAADPGAELYAGLKRGVSRADFERRIQDGTVAECLQRIPVQAGDSMFLPSGRVHAIGAGLVIFEIQQNSDTTFRVFDWNRMGLDGRPRELHVAASLASIDFSDVEPPLVAYDTSTSGTFTVRPLVRDPLFNVDLIRAAAPGTLTLAPQLRIVANVGGRVVVGGAGRWESLAPGQFCVLPAALDDASLTAEKGSAWLMVEAG
jgi:mannose-6-phosphate isomerase